MLRVLGLSQRRIAGAFAIEFIGLGLAASLAGVLAGLAMHLLFVFVLIVALADPAACGHVPPLRLRFIALASALLCGLVILTAVYVTGIPVHARLMVGIWRSPRHTYVYAADGRWWNADSYDWLDKPEGAHGRWRIENQQLVEDAENPSFGGFGDLSRRRIIKFTRDRVIFEGSSMKRWTREDVKNWERP